MNISISKKEFNDKFLNQISKIDNACILTVNSRYISCLTNVEDGSIILYSKLNTATPTGLKDDETKQLDIPDIRRLSRVFDCIDEDVLDLQIDSNSISYDKKGIKFKYYLSEPGIIRKSVANVEKISKLGFDLNFKMTQAKVNEILRASAFVQETAKPRIYFYTKDGNVLGEITDKTLQNTDSMTIPIASTYTGSELKTVLPVSIEAFRSFSGLKYEELTIKVDTKLGILILEINEANLLMKYVVAALIK